MAGAYDEIADWYDESVRAQGSLASRVAEHVVALTGEITGQEVCDLACGQGLVARHLARRGARVTGLDLSTKLLGMARREETAAPLGIIYRWDDAQSLTSLENECFDGVTCSLALMDIPELAATFGAIHRVLRPGGWLVFSITHPCFQIPPSSSAASDGKSPAEGSYFDERFWRSDYPHGVRGQVGAHHRTLSTYLNAMSGAGFILERLLEPGGAGETSRRSPVDPAVPKFLIVRCRKG